MSKDDERWIWHKKLGHINLKHISMLYKKYLVKGLLEMSWKTHLLCDAYLFKPTRTLSLGGKKYIWVYFISHKHESYEVFEVFYKQVQNEKKSDHGKEFENGEFQTFYEKNDIFHNFSSSRTPQQNTIVERKNKTLQEMARTMLYENSLPKHF
ncbi:hypothetical protein CR513_32355, partial [Mucuna pruriens]